MLPYAVPYYCTHVFTMTSFSSLVFKIITKLYCFLLNKTSDFFFNWANKQKVGVSASTDTYQTASTQKQIWNSKSLTTHISLSLIPRNIYKKSIKICQNVWLKQWDRRCQNQVHTWCHFTQSKNKWLDKATVCNKLKN